MFHSVLVNTALSAPERKEAPDYFRDLNLHHVVDAITTGFEPYGLNALYYAPLSSTDTIEYRHEVMRDTDNPSVLAGITHFADAMRTMRENLEKAQNFPCDYQRKRWFLQAAKVYAGAVSALSVDLSSLPLESRGLVGLREYVERYCRSASFCDLRASAAVQESNLDSIRYTVRIRGTRVTVGKYSGAPDYSFEVSGAFRKFQQGAGKEYGFSVADRAEMNHVESQILEIVATLYPQIFTSLTAFCNDNAEFADATLLRFDREIHFYIAYKRLVDALSPLGLSFCYPRIANRDKTTHGTACFDLALAIALKNAKQDIVVNDWSLTGNERILMISGPNQGGKTTFARMIGQAHHLAALGLPVPGRDAKILLADAIFTHFERGENLVDQRGKLQDDLIRIHDIVTQATEHSVVIINEIFSSTTLRDALFLADKVLDTLRDREVLCVCVTFLDTLSRRGEETVSMTSVVDPHNRSSRTFKVWRGPADGRAYALSLAELHGLTYERLKARILA